MALQICVPLNLFEKKFQSSKTIMHLETFNLKDYSVGVWLTKFKADAKTV